MKVSSGQKSDKAVDSVSRDILDHWQRKDAAKNTADAKNTEPAKSADEQAEG
jgi:hypothetical protein